MNEMIKIPRRTVSSTPNLSLLFTVVVTLIASLPVAAHGPGLDEIDSITTQIAKTGEQAALYAKRARVYQNNHMWLEAMSDLDRAVELDSQNTEYDLDRAQLSYEAGEFLRAHHPVTIDGQSKRETRRNEVVSIDGVASNVLANAIADANVDIGEPFEDGFHRIRIGHEVR